MAQRIAVIDYGMGNLHSVAKAVEHVMEPGDEVRVTTEDGRTVSGSHALLAVGAVPNSDGLGLEEAGVAVDRGYIAVNEFQQTSVPHIYAAGDVTGQMPLSSVAFQLTVWKPAAARTSPPLGESRVTLGSMVSVPPAGVR